TASSGSPYTSSKPCPACRNDEPHRCCPTSEHELTLPSPGRSGVAHSTTGSGHCCASVSASCPWPIEGCSSTSASHAASFICWSAASIVASSTTGASALKI